MEEKKCIELKYERFILEQDKNNNRDRFDLYEMKIASSGKNEGKEIKVLIGHSFKFEGALKAIASYSVKDATTIAEYIKEYNEILDKITNVLSN